jgi:gliding motility-associated-like protein
MANFLKNPLQIKKFIFFSVAIYSVIFNFCLSQIITTVAGNGTGSNSCTVGNGGPAIAAMVWNPQSVAIDNSGNYYIGDYGNGAVRIVNSSGIINAVAGGCMVCCPTGDGGPSTASWIGEPQVIATDNSGNLYISAVNSTIRKVNTSGIINTIAGTGTVGYSGDGGPAISAAIHWPRGLAIDGSGNIYIADSYNHRIRKIMVATGIINSIAGTGTQGYSGDGGPAISAQFNYPYGIALDGFGNIFVADESNNRIRKINTSGIITTVAGTGIPGFSGDGGLATSATLNSPFSVAVDLAGNIYIVDSANSRIRKINSGGIITTIAGTGSGFSGDGGPANLAKLNYPTGIALDLAGNIYIADLENNRIRMICNAPSQPGPINGNATVCPGSINVYSVAPVAGVTSYSWNLPSGWNGTSISNTIGISTGTNGGIISVTSVNVCGLQSNPVTFSINVNVPPPVSITANNSSICFGSSVVITGQGANSYTWNTGATTASVMVSPTVTTIYVLTGTDALSCTNSSSITITVNPLPMPNLTLSPGLLCTGETATLNASGATNYTLLPIGLTGSTYSISLISNQTFTLVGEDVNGCINSTPLSFTSTITPTLTLNPFFYLCSGSSTLSASGANSYSWSPGNLYGSMVLVSPTVTTNYTVVGANGICTNSAVTTVSVGSAPPLILSSNLQSGCKGTCFTFSNSSTAFSPYTYDWGDSTFLSPMTSVHCYSLAGIYAVSAQATYSSGCSVISSGVITVTIFPSPFPAINIAGGTSQYINSPISFNNNSTGANSFVWNFGDSSSVFNTLLSNNTAHTYTAAGIYCVKLIATDTVFGCVDSTNKCFDILCLSELSEPNVFTPNGDGINDVFKIISTCITSLTCTIFDRWGAEVYEWEGINGSWDGRTLKGEIVSTGVYFYVLEFKNESGKFVKKKGFVNLFK